MFWYSHLSKNFPQFVVIHTVNGFGVVNKAVVDVFLELSFFFYDPTDVGNLISGSSLPFNMLSRSVIAFFPKSKCLLISWLQSPSAVILEPPKNKV